METFSAKMTLKNGWGFVAPMADSSKKILSIPCMKYVETNGALMLIWP